MEGGGLAGARDLADEAGVEGKANSVGATALAALGLDLELARGVVENRDADMVVGEAVFELLGDLGQHFIGVERGDSVARDEIQEIEMARLGALSLEEAGVFNGDAGFAGEHAKKLKVAFVEGAILIGEDAQRADGVIVGNQRNSAEGAQGTQSIDAEFADFGEIVFANENGLAGAQDVLGEVIAGGARALRHTHAINHFQFKLDGVARGIGSCEIEILHIEKAAQLFPDFAEEIFLIEGGTEDAAEGLFLGLQTDDHNAAQAVLESEFAEIANGLVFFEGGEIVVAEIAETEQAAESGDEANEIVVEPLFLCDAAELVGNAGGNDGGGSGGVAVMKEKRAGGQANDTENTVEGLGKHALNFAADEAGGGEIEVGQGEHVALDAALLFLVNG